MAIHQEQFNLVPDDVFNQFDNPIVLALSKHNFCPECEIPMILAGSDYQCQECGLVQPFAESEKNHDDTVSGSIRISTGTNKGRFYNTTGDYTKIQMKIILDQLKANQATYVGANIPFNVLKAAATQYNRIQKFITEDDLDANGKLRGQKKFVRRGNIKDEVLAALIYFEGVREKVIRKKKDIAVFMKLPTFGFSRGEDILRNLHAEGKINIPVDDEPIDGYVDRYMDGLGLDNQQHIQFVIDIVNESETHKLGMTSQLSSKIVGAMWILVVKCNMKITHAQLEKATDNTKRNTFNKFYNVVMQNINVFRHIFIKYGIPYK